MNEDHDPADTFIGVSLGSNPFDMLGLPRKPAEESTVLAALGARMAEIADHQRSRTPEANELRLALHAAAAQLLDPQLQELLLSSETDSALASPEAPPTRPQRPTPVNSVPSMELSAGVKDTLLSHDLILIVAANGGWNKASMRRLALLAHARGVPSSELPAIVTGVLTTPVQNVSNATADNSPESHVSSVNSRAGSIRTSSAENKQRNAIGGWIVSACFAVLTIGSLFTVWVKLTSEESVPPAESPVPEEQVVSSVRPDSLSRDSSSNDQSPQRTAKDGARYVISSAASSTPQDTLDELQFRSSLDVIASGWTSLEDDRIAAVHNAIIELLYIHAEDTSLALDMIDWVSGPGVREPKDSNELLQSTWVIGTLARLSAERNLSASVDAAIVGQLATLLGNGIQSSAPSFRDGVAIAIKSSGAGLASQQSTTQVWRTWISILRTVDTVGSDSYTRAVLDAIKSLATLAEDPNSSRNVFEAMETLAAELSLDASDEVAKRLVAWHGDEQFSAADLSVIMRTLVRNSSNPDVDADLVLSSNADNSQRMAVRTRLEEILLGVDSGSESASRQWLDLTRQELARGSGKTTIGHLSRATARSRLSVAARYTFWGDYTTAELVLSNLTADLDRIAIASEHESHTFLGGDSSLDWAERYLAARQNIPIRQALLAELTRGRHNLGSVAAEALVRDAFFGTPVAVRTQAQEVVSLYSQSPAITNAVLELLPRLPRIEQSNEIIDRITNSYLPATTDPQWMFIARQRLVETLLNQLSGIGEGAAVDQYVLELAKSYRLRLGDNPATVSSNPASELVQSVEELYLRWESTAESRADNVTMASKLENLRKRRIGRKTLAEGIIERFAAEQVSLVEAMGILIEIERPDAASQIESVLQDMATERRNASNIIEQIEIVETASVMLWQIRLAGGES